LHLGKKTRVSSLTGNHDYNVDFDRLLNDADHGRLRIKTHKDFDRPAYYGTSACPSGGSSQWDGRMLSAKSTKRAD